MKKVVYSLLIIIIMLALDSNLAAADDEKIEFEGNIIFMISQKKKNIDHIYMLDGKNQKLTKLTQKGRNFWPKWSPDGKKIVFVSIRDDHSNFEIYLMEANGKNQRRLTNTLGGNSNNPRWDNSGKKIFYSKTVMGNTQENVLDLTTFEIQTLSSTGKLPEMRPINNMAEYMKEISKKDKKEIEKDLAKIENDMKRLQDIIKARRNMFEYIPSPEGRYHALYYSFARKIALLDIKNNELREIKSQRAGGPAWSKDGKKLAYVNGENGDHFVIFDIDNNQYTEILISKTKYEGCGGVLSWSRDSKKIMYACGTDFIADSSKIYILDLETRQSKAIINGNSPDWY